MTAREWELDAEEPGAERMFVCPGQTTAISRALHLARLGASWSGCDECEWRHHTEGLSERSVSEVVRIRQRRVDGIQRTEFGVRGQWLNALDRRSASELVRIFCLCLLNARAVPETVSGLAPGEPGISRAVLRPVITGYDGRAFSPDLYAGITAAVTEMGFGILDMGRTTMAALQEAIRSSPEMLGGILITGAGYPAAWTGLDVLDSRGEAVPVVWKDFGVRLQQVVDERMPVVPLATEGNVEDRGWQRIMRQIRGNELDATNESSTGLAVSTNARPNVLRLVLPEESARAAWPRRLSRQSGVQRVESFEERYRDWLLRWYPEDYDARLIIRTDDVLLRSRIQWISERARVSLITASVVEPESRGAGLQSLVILEDDRRFEWRDSHGVRISAMDFARGLNTAIGSRASQMTAHADVVTDRLWLTDAARPVSAWTTERIEDALAIAGLTLRLQSQGRLASY